MNRKKKIYQKVKKQLMQAKAKKQPAKKQPYISKADRAALEQADTQTSSTEPEVEVDSSADEGLN